ncbi:MAG TPA: hypothetical protein VK956_08795 [Verrucomicrobium sp.]|nr:hypothetical protein [Verrucomicrobium sp.]
MPAGPLCQTRAPDLAQWIVTFKATGAEVLQPNAPMETNRTDFQKTITKSGSTYHVKILTGTQSVVEKWCVGELQITSMPNAQRPVLATADSPDPYFINLTKGDFEGLGWISAKNFTGVKSMTGVDCLVFKDVLPGESPGVTVPVQAVVDLKTRLPVSLQVGDSLTTYQFNPAPTSELKPPAHVLASAEQWTVRRKQARMVPPP